MRRRLRPGPRPWFHRMAIDDLAPFFSGSLYALFVYYVCSLIVFCYFFVFLLTFFVIFLSFFVIFSFFFPDYTENVMILVNYCGDILVGISGNFADAKIAACVLSNRTEYEVKKIKKFTTFSR